MPIGNIGYLEQIPLISTKLDHVGSSVLGVQKLEKKHNTLQIGSYYCSQ